MMLPIPNCTLDQNDLIALSAQQGIINAEADYENEVKTAKTLFASKPKALFDRVRTSLETVAGDLVRCGYCEDSCADEVEHVWPKNFFPERTFDHTNFLFACGRCNSAKSDKFGLKYNNEWLDLTKHRKAHGYNRVPSNRSRFIDPKTESPMDLLWLDIAGGSLNFVAMYGLGVDDDNRANFTIEALRLNQSTIVNARKNAYSGFVGRIVHYITEKQNDGHPDILSSILDELRRAPHQTVRHEMGRQINNIRPPHPNILNYLEVFI